MKIKEIRDFKELSLVEQREKLKVMKQLLYFIRAGQIAISVPVLYGGYAIVDFLKNGADITSVGIITSINLAILGALSWVSSQQHNDIIEVKTIMKLEDELTRERTL